MDILEYRSREYLGDRLLEWILAQLIFNDRNPKDKFERGRMINRIRTLSSNNNLSIVAQNLGLIPHKDDKQNPKKRWGEPKIFANAYEVWVYTLYLTKGIEETILFVKKTLLDDHTVKHKR